MTEKKELVEFNYLRAIGIILVVLGHSFPYIDSIENNFFRYVHSLIYSFHMPLFIMISGFFAYKSLNIKSFKEYKSFIFNKFKRLMVPYFLISALTIPIKLLLNKFSERPLVLSEIMKDILLYPWNNPIIFFWYIYVLFLIFLIAPIIFKINKYIVLLIFTLLSILPLEGVHIFGISTIFKYSIFFFLGVYINEIYLNKRNSIINKPINILNMLIFVIIPYIIFFMNLNIISLEKSLISSMIINLFWIFKGPLGIYVSFTLSVFIYRLKILNKMFNLLSKYSFDIYLLSWFPQIFVRILFLQVLNLNYGFVSLLSFISGFTPIILSIIILRRFKVTKSLFLGIPK